MGSVIGFYGIISEPRVGYVTMAEAMVAMGVRWIQLRMKGASFARREMVARDVRACVPPGHRLIVNDDPALALSVGADGVHLGQGDMPYADARAILGPGAHIGLSTHSPEQVLAACAHGPSYLGMGPVFATDTKLDTEPTIGLDGLARMVSLSAVPAVAIGGVGPDRVVDVMSTGVQGLCSVGAVNRSVDPSAVIGELLRSLRQGGQLHR